MCQGCRPAWCPALSADEGASGSESASPGSEGAKAKTLKWRGLVTKIRRSETMSAEDNTAIARHYLEEAWNRGNAAILDEVFAADYVFHEGSGRTVRDIETNKRNVSAWRTAFPDFHMTIEDAFAAGDKVVLRWTIHFTHQGQSANIPMEMLRNVPPTGKQVSFTGMDIYYLRGGKIAEAWRTWDRLGLLQQVGVVAP